MYRYRVDFYLDGQVIDHAYVSAWSRKEAWFESWATPEYRKALERAHREDKTLSFDATRLDHPDEV